MGRAGRGRGMKFEYEGAPRSRPGVTPGWPVIRRPIVSVRVIGPAGSEDLRGRIDTGSDDTVLPRDLARRLGITLEGPSVVLRGIAGEAAFRQGRVILELHKGKKVIRRVTSVGSWNNDDNFKTLFGLNGFLEYFSAQFNGEREHVVLLRNRNMPETTAATP